MKQAWNLAGVFLLLASITAMSAGETAEIYALSDSYKLNKEGTKIWSLATLDLAALKKKSRIWDGATSTISLAAARRETVAFQIILQAGDGGATDVDVVVEDLKGPQGAIAATQIHLFKEWYVKTASTSSENCNPSTGVGWYPDALVPWDVKDHGAFDGAPFAIEKNMAQAVWVDIDVPAGIPAGDYQGRVIVRKFFVKQPGANPEGDQLSAGTPLNLRVRVRDLELPRETHHLLFGNGAAADIWSAGGASLKDKPEQKAKYEEEMFRMARKHRITLGN
ncbi:MAG TPA: hypothetical protein VL860_08055, partial [Planctomycetota bacterium]|nr:hypothetical protein [Planctomycetota bacterium]